MAGRKIRMSYAAGADVSVPRYIMGDPFLGGMDCAPDAEPALCAVEVGDSDDLWNTKSVRIDL